MTTHARALLTAVGAVIIGLIFWLDHMTGSRIGFALFYILPVAAAGWFLGLAPSLVLAVTATAGWFLADQSAWGWETPLVGAWNAVTRLLIFGALGAAAARLRYDRAELEQANLQLSHLLALESSMARTDLKTGLPNSRHFIEQLGREMARARREHCPIALMYIDLDDFKGVNDLYGHAGGDRVLASIAAGILSVTRGSDVCARLGGDEFAVLLWNVSAAEAARAAERVRLEVCSVSEEFPRAKLGSSIGLVHCAQAGDDPEELIRRADHEMYRAKKAGKDRVSIRSDA